jgi:glycosyltransferase involved in cell wall biosynthesis
MCLKRKRRTVISLIVPFQTNEPARIRSWKWLKQYWQIWLPGCEIIIGTDPKSRKRWYRRNPPTFSKTVAINRAFRKTHGDIIVIVDSDVYLDASVVQHCADRIRSARNADIKMWFMPYLTHYRLNEEASDLLLNSSPGDPLRFTTPPSPRDIMNAEGHFYGHLWGALVQIMPTEALRAVGGGDERFRGWGGEDTSLMVALDALWANHKNTTNQVLHVWHPQLRGVPTNNRALRVWEGQTNPRANDDLAGRYLHARRSPDDIRAIIAERHIPRWRRLTRVGLIK